MPLVFVLILLLILAAVAAITSGWGAPMSDAPHDRRPWRLPDGPVGSEAFASLRFTPALRGYRCDEVDAVVSRLVVELADREERIAALEGRPRPATVGLERPGGSVPTADA